MSYVHCKVFGVGLSQLVVKLGVVTKIKRNFIPSSKQALQLY
jgi:hypothetical protein